jgi:hypothetical protein
MLRERLTRIFLWISALSWGVGAGAKLFDLLVLAGAWGASPPASLALYPYGHSWPYNPGTFFQPLSAVLLVASLGALICGWQTRWKYRIWLWSPVIAFILIWITTPTVFWPMINEIYGIAHGKIVRSDLEVTELVHRWIIADWLRVAVIAVGFVSSVRAISTPYTHKD